MSVSNDGIKLKNLKLISGALILLSIFFGLQYNSCQLSFKTDVTIATVLSILLNFGVIGILIERFTDHIIIKKSFQDYNYALKGGMTFQLTENSTPDDAIQKHKEKFYWISFAIGLVIASIGFRYFHNVIDTSTLVTCTSSISQSILFAIVDTFLSGILMAGGAALVLEIMEWFKKK